MSEDYRNIMKGPDCDTVEAALRSHWVERQKEFYPQAMPVIHIHSHERKCGFMKPTLICPLEPFPSYLFLGLVGKGQQDSSPPPRPLLEVIITGPKNCQYEGEEENLSADSTDHRQNILISDYFLPLSQSSALDLAR